VVVSHKSLLIAALLIIALAACKPEAALLPLTADNPPATLAPTKAPAAVLPSATFAPTKPPAASLPSFEGAPVFYGPLNLVIPPGLASGVRGSQFSRSEGPKVAPWDVTPGHTQLKLEGYLLQGKSQEPMILIYPAQSYAEQYPNAFESIRRLDNILGTPGAPISSAQLPTVPSFNAKQAFASNIQLVSFQNGRGVRFLTEYAQYPVSANNQDLFYHFQGLTSDGTYYIIAIFPIAVPVLADTSDGGAVLPHGGVAYTDITRPSVDWQGYYTAVTNLLNAQSPEAFAPAINRLDSLIQSMRITR
jgi:hypothetical protein